MPQFCAQFVHFFKTGTIYLRVNLIFSILLFIDHIEIFIKKHYIALSVALNLFETNMVLLLGIVTPSFSSERVILYAAGLHYYSNSYALH